jgi:uncharacterized protein
MNSATHIVSIVGPAGGIDTAIDLPSGDLRGIALVAHPHPLFGGTRDNKVVQTLARTFVSLGYASLRPNFRGVGASEGSHDEGLGETEDLLAVIADAHARFGAAHDVVLAGFSFGSFVQSRVAQRLRTQGTPARRLVLVGTATSRFSVEPVPEDSVVIHGELDDVVPLGSVLEWARQGSAPVIVIPGADHFFHRRLTTIKRIVLRAWGQSVPATEEPDAH